MGDKIPTEEETIAAKRAERVAEKLKRSKDGFYVPKAWWSTAALEVSLLTLILILNFYLIFPFFGTQAPDAFFSGPVIPLIAKLIEVLGPELSYSIQIVNIIFFLFFPITLYFFIKKVSGRKAIAFLASLIATLPFYPLGYVRITSAMLSTDSAHIASLTIVPIALLGLYSFLREGGVGNLAIACLFSAAVALISPFGFATFAIFSFILGFSEMLLGRGRQKLFRLGVVFLFALSLTSFWYNPGFFFWMLTGPLGEEIRSTVTRLIPISFFTLPVLGVFGYLLFDRKPQLQSTFLASFFSIAFALIALAGGGIFPSHPSRYISEFGISLSFLLGIVIVRIYDLLSFSEVKLPKNINPKPVAKATMVLIILLIISATFFGRERVIFDSGQVLGVWEGVEKGEIWLAKENFKGGSEALGYVITFTSLFGLGIVAAKAKREGSSVT